MRKYPYLAIAHGFGKMLAVYTHLVAELVGYIYQTSGE